MRPTTSWADLPGRRVGVWGLGVEGRAALRRLAADGIEPVLVDDRPPAEPVEGRPVLATAAGGLDALLTCDVVVKTPGKSRYDDDVRQLQATGVEVVGGLGLWLAGARRDRVVAITGTKGKSSTTAIAAHLLGRFGYRAMAGGNLGRPPFDPEVGDDFDWWVIETSSYQATDVGLSPAVTAVTSLHPDHLPWHRHDAETYYGDKLSLCGQPGARLTVANGDSPLLRQRAGLLAPEVRWVGADDDPSSHWMDGLGLLGAHSRRNALIARACLEALGVPEAADEDALAAATAGFEHLSSRLEPVGTVDGVLFVDDGLSTNVLPTLAALDAHPGRRVALIVGGTDRSIDFVPLADGLARRPDPTLVLVVDTESGPRIEAALKGRDLGPLVTVESAPDDAEAARTGFTWARPDGVVLLSPASPSFDRFANYRARAAAFRAAMATCGPVDGGPA
jgi:UDP-N-acetylmuramoylalanine--D-glutamate ligase